VEVRRGKPPPRFLADCRDLARDAGLRSGTVRAVRAGKDVRLVFSGVPEPFRQRLRNIWAAR
jgi:hypothetical protein